MERIQLILHIDDLLQVIQEPRVDLRDLMDLIDTDVHLQSVPNIEDIVRLRHFEPVEYPLPQFGQLILRQLPDVENVLSVGSQPEPALFERAKRLLERFLEC